MIIQNFFSNQKPGNRGNLAELDQLLIRPVGSHYPPNLISIWSVVCLQMCRNCLIIQRPPNTHQTCAQSDKGLFANVRKTQNCDKHMDGWTDGQTQEQTRPFYVPFQLSWWGQTFHKRKFRKWQKSSLFSDTVGDLHLWPMTFGKSTWGTITNRVCGKFEKNPSSACRVVTLTPINSLRWSDTYMSVN